MIQRWMTRGSPYLRINLVVFLDKNAGLSRVTEKPVKRHTCYVIAFILELGKLRTHAIGIASLQLYQIAL